MAGGVFLAGVFLLWLVFSGRAKVVWAALTTPAPKAKP